MARVITSYSIHYTKLYEVQSGCGSHPRTGHQNRASRLTTESETALRATAASRPHGFRVGATRLTLFLAAALAGFGGAAVQFLPATLYVTQDSRRMRTTRQSYNFV